MINYCLLNLRVLFNHCFVFRSDITSRLAVKKMVPAVQVDIIIIKDLIKNNKLIVYNLYYEFTT